MSSSWCWTGKVYLGQRSQRLQICLHCGCPDRGHWCIFRSSEGKSRRLCWFLQNKLGGIPQLEVVEDSIRVHLGHRFMEKLLQSIPSSGFQSLDVGKLCEGRDHIHCAPYCRPVLRRIPSTCVSKNIIYKNNFPKSTEKNTSNGKMERSLGTHTSDSWCSSFPMSLPLPSLVLCFC